MKFKEINQYYRSTLCEDGEQKAVEWVEYLMGIVDAVALKSKDPSTKVGCIAVDPSTKRILATGYNGFPSKVLDLPERWTDKPTKYQFVCHAEANVIAASSRFGIQLQGAVLFVNCHPCTDCAKLIASAGISEIFYLDSGIEANPTSDWHFKLKTAKTIFKEAGVKLTALIR